MTTVYVRRKPKKKRYCACGKKIPEFHPSGIPNRAVRCKPCSIKYNKNYIKVWKRKHRKHKTPAYRECSRCYADISDYHYHAELCRKCRKWNKKRVDRDYYWRNKKNMNKQASDYYYRNREAILDVQKTKRHLEKIYKQGKKVLV